MSFLRYLSATALVLGAACSPEVGKQYVKGEVISNFKQDKPKDNYTLPMIDILFVIDDSGSMDSYQQALKTNLPVFLTEFTSRVGIDYHIAVTTSSCDYYSSKCGEFFGTEKVVTSKSVDPLVTLKNNVVVGTSGDTTEMFFDPIVSALSEPLISHENAGFLRAKAPLVIIFITDAQEQSAKNTADSTYKFLLKLKGNKKNVLAYGVYIPSWFYNQGCQVDTGPGTKISEFLALVSNANPPGDAHANSFFLCGDFEKKLTAIGKDISDKVGRIFLLNELPREGSIKVFYGDVPVKADENEGWSYDIGRNAVSIGPNFVWDPPGSGRQISVQYDAYDPLKP